MKLISHLAGITSEGPIPGPRLKELPMVRRVLPCIFAALVGCRCHREHAAEASDRYPEASDRWLMQSYDVPADDALALLSQLKDLFVISKGDKGRQLLADRAR